MTKKRMWSVNATVVGGKHLGFYEAETADEAIDEAMKKDGGVHLCHHCAGECENAELENVTAEPVDEV